MRLWPLTMMIMAMFLVPQANAKELIAQKVLSGLTQGREVQVKVRDKYIGEDLAGRNTLFRLTNAQGYVRDRIMNRYVKDYRGVKKYMIRIASPPDIRKTGLLIFENRGSDDTRFLYLPALKKTRRVNTKDKGQSFIGSDFTFEDLGTVPIEEYTYTATETVNLNGSECYYYVCHAVPGSGAVYKKINTWTCKKSYIRIRMEYYDKDDRLLKIFTAEDITLLPAGDRGVWTPHHLTMKNVQDGHQTEFFMRSVKYNIDLPDEIFSLSNLETLSSENM